MKISVIGCGGWGLAVRSLLEGNGHDVSVWCFLEDEYKMLQEVRRDYPGYKVVIITRKPSSKKDTYKGLTYDYMEKYIKAHDDKDQSIMAEYEMLRGISEEAIEALAEPCSYLEIRDWFLKTFPAIAEFHKKREAALAA